MFLICFKGSEDWTQSLPVGYNPHPFLFLTRGLTNSLSYLGSDPPTSVSSSAGVTGVCIAVSSRLIFLRVMYSVVFITHAQDNLPCTPNKVLSGKQCQ